MAMLRSSGFDEHCGMSHREASPAASLRTNTIWAAPRAASVGKKPALVNPNPAPTVKKLNKNK
jgi:hypothetical protein